jgi:hypothetical protein
MRVERESAQGKPVLSEVQDEGSLIPEASAYVGISEGKRLTLGDLEMASLPRRAI